MTCQRSGLAFEFAWLPMVMFGGRLGSVLTLAEIQSYLISFCQSEWARLSKQSPLCCAEVLAGAIAFSFHLGVDLLQAPCFKPEGSRVQYRMSSAICTAEGLDFKPFWCPVFWVFLPDVQALWHGQARNPLTSKSPICASTRNSSRKTIILDHSGSFTYIIYRITYDHIFYIYIYIQYIFFK